MNKQIVVYPYYGLLLTVKRYKLLIHTTMLMILKGIMAGKTSYKKTLHIILFHHMKFKVINIFQRVRIRN